MSIKIKIKINNKEIECEAGEKILEVANKNGIEIPSFCYHPDFCTKGNCRVCVVEVTGCDKLMTSCSLVAKDGMEVFTNTERAVIARDTNIELIYAEHIEKCGTCIWRFECKILHYASKFGIKINFFADRKADREIYKFDNAVELDGTQCIDCRNCLDACQMMGLDYLEIKNKGHEQEIVPSADKRKKCILCGQCAVHCPVSAAQEQASWKEVEDAIRDESKIVVAQMPRMIKASIGEDFGIEAEKISMEAISGSLRKIGFDYVFETDAAIDDVSILEAGAYELSIQKNNLPLLSSHCAAWVNYVERLKPELAGKLSKTESSHLVSGKNIRDYLAGKGIEQQKIIVVSIMPCTAKKFEISRPEKRQVDAVLTFRELVYMLKKTKVDSLNVEAAKIDAVITEKKKPLKKSNDSLLDIVNKANAWKLRKADFKETEFEGVSEWTIKASDKTIKIAKVIGLKNISAILNKASEYDYIDVYACPDGCFGGGGQPIPTSAEIRKKRMASYFSLQAGQ